MSLSSSLLPRSVFASPSDQIRATEAGPTIKANPFPVSQTLRPRVDFLVKVFTEWDSRTLIAHDSNDVTKVVEVMKVAASDSVPKALRKLEKKWKRSRSGVRIQQGLKDKFEAGYTESARYLPEMEAVFEQMGLPILLTRLPFVESSFNIAARSKVGAVGMWQFMRSTGRQYLKINSVMDERIDPIRSTEAAAKLMRNNIDTLTYWPLAITAYNHGKMGVLRATKTLMSHDLDVIIRHYQKRSFGFASENFYASFVAATEAEEKLKKALPKITRAARWNVFEVTLPQAIKSSNLCTGLQMSCSELQSLNPSLARVVWSNRVSMPANIRLRLPLRNGQLVTLAVQSFYENFGSIPVKQKVYANAYRNVASRPTVKPKASRRK